MISLRSTYLSCALLALSTVPAFSTPVFYATQASWLTAVSSPSTVTFDTDAVTAYNTFTTGLVLPDNPSFTALVDGSGGFNLQVTPGTGSYYSYGTGHSLAWTALGGSVTSSILEVTFATPVSAISLNFMTYAAGNIFDVQVNNSDSTVVNTTTGATPGYPNEGFFGITSTTSISSIYLYLPPSETGVTPIIDNFSFAASLAQQDSGGGDTPELATFLLIASGLIGMALLGRRGRGQLDLREIA